MTALSQQWTRLSPSTWFEVCQATDTQLNTVEGKFGVAGKTIVLLAIQSEIDRLLKFFNVRNTMTDDQLMEVSELLYETWPQYKLSDFIFFCKEVKKGNIGKVWDRVDGNMIIGWFKEYDDKKMQWLESRHKDNKQISDFYMKMKVNAELEKEGYTIEKLMKEIGNINRNKRVAVEYKIDVDPDIQMFVAEFDAMWDDQQAEMEKMYGRHKTRLVDYKGKHHDHMSYLQTRVKEEKK